MLNCLVFTVTNNLTYDQRMQRICGTLAANGYKVLLVGRNTPNSPPLNPYAFDQKRLPCLFNKGKWMYAEYNLRLLFFLLSKKADCICAIDLDTIIPVLIASKIKGTLRVYDAHELFTEQKEIVTRPLIQKMWLAVEKFAVPKFLKGYTVNHFIMGELQRRYRVQYAIVRNLPAHKPFHVNTGATEKIIIYQGAVNEGRGFEYLVPAMKQVDAHLLICGKGNFFEQLKILVNEHGVGHKVTLRGYVPPNELAKLTPTAYCAVMLFENTGLNQYYSLANRFFDYIMAGVPQVCVSYPEYKAINDKYGVAWMIDDISTESIVSGLNKLLTDAVVYNNIHQHCLVAREVLNWDNEQKILINFYKNLLS